MQPYPYQPAAFVIHQPAIVHTLSPGILLPSLFPFHPIDVFCLVSRSVAWYGPTSFCLCLANTSILPPSFHQTSADPFERPLSCNPPSCDNRAEEQAGAAPAQPVPDSAEPRGEQPPRGLRAPHQPGGGAGGGTAGTGRPSLLHFGVYHCDLDIPGLGIGSANS